MNNLQLRSIAMFHTEKPERKAREREMRLLIAKDMADVLTNHAGQRLRWKSTKTDLMEALHWTYMNDTLVTADGQPCGFQTMVVMACKLFGISEPRNPRCLVNHAMMKKGVRQSNLCAKCSIIAQTERTSHPVLKFISFPK